MSIVNSVASILSPREDRKTAMVSLAELDKSDHPDIKTAQSFQYFPETISDGRAVEYMTKNGIGGSHPLYQWLHGSARTLSFEATFTSEEAPDPSLGGVTGALDSLGSTISGAVKNPISTAISMVKGKDAGNRYSVNVAAAIAWLRAKTYPTYSASRVAKAPPKLMMYLPGSGITSGVSAAGFPITDSVPVIMLRCDVNYEAFFRTGQPRIASVSLEFAEIIQLGSNWTYVDRSAIDAQWRGKYTLRDEHFSSLSGGSSGNLVARAKSAVKKTTGLA